MRIAVTGASGFVGGHVCRALLQRGWRVRALVRSPREGAVPAGCEPGLMPDLDGAQWEEGITGCDAVVHLAARVHRPQERDSKARSAYQRENVDATVALARASRNTGVGRLVFMSTIKVFGERSDAAGFKLSDPTAPEDAYGASKLEAELQLSSLAAAGGPQVAIVRPPLVYGPGVKANFLRLLRQVDRRLPVPVSDAALRSLVFAPNLADLCAHLLENPIPQHATFLVADEPALSTRELVEHLAGALGRRARTVRVPDAAAELLGGVPMIGPMLRRLTSSLTLDTAESFQMARWRPPVGIDAALLATAAWYRQEFI